MGQIGNLGSPGSPGGFGVRSALSQGSSGPSVTGQKTPQKDSSRRNLELAPGGCLCREAPAPSFLLGEDRPALPACPWPAPKAHRGRLPAVSLATSSCRCGSRPPDLRAASRSPPVGGCRGKAGCGGPAPLPPGAGGTSLGGLRTQTGHTEVPPHQTLSLEETSRI